MTSALPQFGRYPTLGVLGEGGMGTVYLARHPELGCDLAIKVLLSARGADDPARKRFLLEVSALTQLRHPGVVTVVDAGEQDGVPWLAMIRVEGGSLQDHLGTRGPLSAARTISLGLQLCEALDAAHGRGLLHRDLKPDNVLCAAEGRYVITDFGLTKDLSQEASVRLTQTGALQGTPGYWAPEQASGKGKRATEQTDVYGIGAVLYAALTGGPPIAAPSLLEAIVATLERSPTPPSELVSVPPELERVVLRCLEKEPAARWASTAELGLALSACADEVGAQREAQRGFVLRRVLALTLGVAVLGAAAVAARPWSSGSEVANAAQPGASANRAAPLASLEIGAPPPGAQDALTAKVLFDRARLAFEQGLQREAVVLLRRAADKGHAKAMNNLAVMLTKGQGVAQDEAQAALWYRRSAEKGNADAMNNLAVMLTKGQGVAQDEAQAAVWYRRAAESGSAPAMLTLAGMLTKGQGGEKDEAQALLWFRRAADAGYAPAMNTVGLIYESGQGLAKDPAQAVLWFRRAADKGNADAMFNLATRLEDGRGAAKDKAQAVVWYRRAAKKGAVPAMFNLAVMLASGEGVAKDEAQAALWYRRAANKGDADAMYNLAFMLANGQGAPKDEAKAIEWFRRAAESPGASATVKTNARIWLKRLGGQASPGSSAKRLQVP